MTELAPEPMTELAPETAAPTYVQVALNLPLRREFTYALPAGLAASPGHSPVLLCPGCGEAISASRVRCR
jgi:primosomal protein N'